MSDRLKVFVSSSMSELGPERSAVKVSLEQLEVEAWVFEDDAGARPRRIQDVYLKNVDESDLYLGIFWKRYGEYTIEEYERARSSGRDCLIYEKRTELTGREDQLQAFLDRIGDVETGSQTIRWFDTADELGEAVRKDVARWLTETIRARRQQQVPRLLPYQCNGKDQTFQIQQSTNDHVQRKDNRHILCFTHGYRREHQRELLEVLASQSLPAALSTDQAAVIKALSVSWPATTKTYEQRKTRLVSAISELAFKRVLSLGEAADCLDEHQGPLLIHTHLHTADLESDPRGTLEQFVRFWNEWPLRAGGHPLFAFCCVHYRNAEEDAAGAGKWFSKMLKRESAAERSNRTIRDVLTGDAFFASNERVRVVLTPELTGVHQNDAEAWAESDDVDRVCHGGRTCLRKRLEGLYESEMAVPDRRISMDPLGRELETMLIECRGPGS